MTYNILCGGQAHVNGQDRIADILSVISDASPDILALQEANDFHLPEVQDRFCSALSMPFVQIARARPYLDGLQYHVALFSRFALRDAHVFPASEFESAVLSVLAETPLGPVTVCAVHLHATQEDRRLGEIQTVLARQRALGRQILLGDFNAISRNDPYPSPQSEFEARTEVTDRVSSHLVDLFASAPNGPHWTHPSRAKADHDRKINRRIDYIYASPDLAEWARGPRVIRTDRAHSASDHFPLVVDFVRPQP